VLLSGALIGCSRRPAESGGEADRQLTSLVERARGIRAKLAADTSARFRLEPEWKDLVTDVKEWQARTGRTDIRTSIDSVRTPATSAAARDDGGGGEDCPSCQGYMIEGDKVCFLADEGDCLDLDEWTGRVCVYDCIWIGSGTPERQGEAEKK
jgi:hypothetical protein